MGRLFAISDIHGCFKPFHELIVNTIKLKKTDQLVLLGDYIDRGGHSKDVVDFILDLIKEGFIITPLTGNHEVMLIDAYHNPDMLPLWLMNSGDTTLSSFGITDIRELDNNYLEFFTRLEYYTKIGSYFFVHAGFDDYAIDPFSVKHNMVWECRPSYENPVFLSKSIIHGHRPKTISYITNLIIEKSNVIPVDTGCVYAKEQGYGNLSALEVSSMILYSVPGDTNML